MPWFSAMIVYRMESRNLKPLRVDSVVVFKARDFGPALKRAKQIAKKTAGVHFDIKLTFCHVENLDLIGKSVDGREVWASFTPLRKGESLNPDVNRKPDPAL